MHSAEIPSQRERLSLVQPAPAEERDAALKVRLSDCKPGDAMSKRAKQRKDAKFSSWTVETTIRSLLIGSASSLRQSDAVETPPGHPQYPFLRRLDQGAQVCEISDLTFFVKRLRNSTK